MSEKHDQGIRMVALAAPPLLFTLKFSALFRNFLNDLQENNHEARLQEVLRQ